METTRTQHGKNERKCALQRKQNKTNYGIMMVQNLWNYDGYTLMEL